VQEALTRNNAGVYSHMLFTLKVKQTELHIQHSKPQLNIEFPETAREIRSFFFFCMRTEVFWDVVLDSGRVIYDVSKIHKAVQKWHIVASQKAQFSTRPLR